MDLAEYIELEIWRILAPGVLGVFGGSGAQDYLEDSVLWGNLAEAPDLKTLEPENLEPWEFGGVGVWRPENIWTVFSWKAS